MVSRTDRPSIEALRAVTQPPEIMARPTEHWTGTLYQRRLSPYLTRVLLPTGISANGVTYLMMISGSLAAVGLLVPGIVGAVLGVFFAQLQMFFDCSDGEVARWRGTSSPMGIFLDRVGHYLAETLIALALGVRAAGGLAQLDAKLGWFALGAVLAWILGMNKALNDMVHTARAAAGLDKLADDSVQKAPRSGLLARLRTTARFVPFHRIYHSIELTLIILVAAMVDAVRSDLAGTRVLLVVVVVLAAVSTVGHFVAIVASSRLRSAPAP